MSRTQWWSLTALLAVVLGLLCGPVAFAAGGAAGRVGTASAAVEAGAATAAEAVAAAEPVAEAEAAGTASAVATAAVVGAAPASAEAAPASAPLASADVPPVSAYAPPASADAADDGTRVPGCGKFRDHDGEPAVPSRARAGHDLAAGLAPWGLPEAGAPSAAPPAQIRARAPAPYTPTPVELSVLRV
ncbi:hypothetical protein [Streptomyces griseus]|uniref:hypothetical protein n=1 Tax=Streptomyces griseus TaxID=1911 RepID=UPI0004C86F7A|nr:hypothetical protein [Streptomyces griseus]